MIYLSKLTLKDNCLNVVNKKELCKNELISHDSLGLISKIFNEVLELNYSLQEHNYIICFGAKMSANIFLVSVGNETSCPNYSREIIEFLVMSRAKGFIMVHNHPGRTEISPSKEDYATFDMFDSISKLLDIPFYDYVVIGNNKYYSAKENGDMED